MGGPKAKSRRRALRAEACSGSAFSIQQNVPNGGRWELATGAVKSLGESGWI